jgi:ABC-type spermidine/putrescine transport system permease subunit II
MDTDNTSTAPALMLSILAATIMGVLVGYAAVLMRKSGRKLGNGLSLCLMSITDCARQLLHLR